MLIVTRWERRRTADKRLWLWCRRMRFKVTWWQRWQADSRRLCLTASLCFGCQSALPVEAHSVLRQGSLLPTRLAPHACLIPEHAAPA
eukprot:COSAG03_NODE_2324_length_2886_cov_5.983124_2_plen_88_part_00